MSLYQVFSIMKQSLGMVFWGIVIGIAIYVLGYKGIYEKCMHGKARLSKSKGIMILVYCSYLIVVLNATLIMRETSEEHLVKLGLLASYKKAWNCFCLEDYGLFLLNIAMFIPIGMFSPMVISKCKRAYTTYLLGLLLTIIIESEQYITKRGLFEIPDIVHNSLGCMIGYGIWFFIYTIYRKFWKGNVQKIAIRKVIWCQIPLILSIGLFGGIFVTYHVKELGNLPSAYTAKRNMTQIKLSTKVQLSDKRKTELVYKGKIGKSKDTLEVANTIFKVHNTVVDNAQTRSFGMVDFYQSMDRKYCCYVYDSGIRVWYINLASTEVCGKLGYSLEEIRKIMKPYGIILPDSSKVRRKSNGDFEVQVNMEKDGEEYIDGILSGCMNKKQELIQFRNNLLHLKKYKKFNIISEKEAFKQIEKGKFQYQAENEIKEITVQEVCLKRELDTKGFYRPVYDFLVKTEKDNGHIYINAIE